MFSEAGASRKTAAPRRAMWQGTDWYVRRAAESLTGPFTAEQLRRDFAAGRLAGDCRVCRVGTEAWITLDAFALQTGGPVATGPLEAAAPHAPPGLPPPPPPPPPAPAVAAPPRPAAPAVTRTVPEAPAAVPPPAAVRAAVPPRSAVSRTVGDAPRGLRASLGVACGIALASFALPGAVVDGAPTAFPWQTLGADPLGTLILPVAGALCLVLAALRVPAAVQGAVWLAVGLGPLVLRSGDGLIGLREWLVLGGALVSTAACYARASRPDFRVLRFLPLAGAALVAGGYLVPLEGRPLFAWLVDYLGGKGPRVSGLWPLPAVAGLALLPLVVASVVGVVAAARARFALPLRSRVLGHALLLAFAAVPTGLAVLGGLAGRPDFPAWVQRAVALVVPLYFVCAGLAELGSALARALRRLRHSAPGLSA
ncbi:MAG: hypothetical protein HY908_27635 [Myxococcales bacterium]|nr:hypothetical protein [Myxococcales bacterium]